MKHSCKTNPGFILITVMLTVLLLTALLLEFNYASRTQLDKTDQFCREYQALNFAQAGINLAIAAINSNSDIRTNQTLKSMTAGNARFNIDSGFCSITVINEAGKININLLKDKNGKLDHDRIDQTLRLIDLLNKQRHQETKISYNVVSAIVDWIDSDNMRTLLSLAPKQTNTTESNYYFKKQPAQTCRNKPFDTIHELLAVPGINREILYGSNNNNENDKIGLCQLLTVRGNGKINLNNSPALVLESISPAIDPLLARMILQRRKIKPFDNIAELKTIPGITQTTLNKIGPYLTCQSSQNNYSIISQGTSGDTRCTIQALITNNQNTGKFQTVFYREIKE